MIGLVVVVLMVFHTCGELFFGQVGSILRNEYQFQEHYDGASPQGLMLCYIALASLTSNSVVLNLFPGEENANLILTWFSEASIKKQ